MAAIAADGAATRAAIDAVFGELRVWLARRGLDEDELEQVSSEAVRRLIQAAEDRRLDPSRAPGAWLRTVAEHLATDLVRKRRPTPLMLDETSYVQQSVEDERLARMLDADAASADVLKALRRAGDEGDHQSVRVVTSWLRLAELTGEAPSTRDVKAETGLSHMTVHRAMARFSRFFVQECYSDLPPSVKD